MKQTRAQESLSRVRANSCRCCWGGNLIFEKSNGQTKPYDTTFWKGASSSPFHIFVVASLCFQFRKSSSPACFNKNAGGTARPGPAWRRAPRPWQSARSCPTCYSTYYLFRIDTSPFTDTSSTTQHSTVPNIYEVYVYLYIIIYTK